MKKALRRKPSASMVVALIALCIAASGTAIAASKLVSGNKLIAKNSLSGNRLRRHTVTGKQINLKKLGKVPSAKNADHAASATHASNADTVGGQSPSAFVPASKFVTSGSLIKITGAPAPGHKQTVISSGPFTVTVTCTKTGSIVTESMDASSSEANSDLDGTLEPAGTTKRVENLTSATFLDDENTNIDLAAPSGATLDFVEAVGINSLGSDCWVHFFGFS